MHVARYARTVFAAVAVAVGAAVLAAGCGRAHDEPPPPPTSPTPAPPPASTLPVDIPGRAPEPLVIYAAGSEPAPGAPPPRGVRDLAFDATDLYLLDSRTHELLRQPRAGGDPIDVAQWTGEHGKLVLTATGAYVSGLQQAVTELGKKTGARHAIVWGVDPVQDFTADATTVYCATTNYYGVGPHGPDGQILAVAIADQKQKVLADKLPGPVAIDVDDAYVYFAEQGKIARIAKTGGGAPAVIADLGEDYGWMVHVAAGYAYFTVQTTSTVYLGRVPIAGGPIERIANLRTQPTGFAIAGDDLYLVAESDQAEVGTLWRIRLSTHELTAIATHLVGYPFVAADAGAVAWLSGEDAFLLPAGARTPIRVHPESAAHG